MSAVGRGDDLFALRSEPVRGARAKIVAEREDAATFRESANFGGRLGDAGDDAAWRSEPQRDVEPSGVAAIAEVISSVSIASNHQRCRLRPTAPQRAPDEQYIHILRRAAGSVPRSLAMTPSRFNAV
jgi:hypothetical protein